MLTQAYIGEFFWVHIPNHEVQYPQKKIFVFLKTFFNEGFEASFISKNVISVNWNPYTYFQTCGMFTS